MITHRCLTGPAVVAAVLLCCLCALAVGQTNLAAARDGARVVAVSSSYGSHWDAANLIDGDPATSWATADGKTEYEWAIVKLASRRAVEIGSIAIDNTPSRDNPPEAGLRDYKLLVSTTGRAPEDFSQVELGSCRLAGGRQVLTFIPARAKFVKLILRSNHGHPGWIEVAELEVFAAGAPPVERGVAPAVLLHSKQGDLADGPFAELAASLGEVGAQVTAFPGAKSSRNITLGTLIGIRVVVTSGDPPLTKHEIEVLSHFCRRGGGLVCAVPAGPGAVQGLIEALGGNLAPAEPTTGAIRPAEHWITEGLSLTQPSDAHFTVEVPVGLPLATRGETDVVAVAAPVGSGLVVALPYQWLVASGEAASPAVSRDRLELARRAVLWAAGMEEVEGEEPRPPVQLAGKGVLLVGDADGTGGLSFDRLKSALRDRGLQVVESRKEPGQFARADLGDADLLIAFMPVFGPHVALDVAKWVESGGALLVMGSAEAQVSSIMAANAFLREFGTAMAVFPAKNLAVAVESHPATAGMDALSRPGDALGVWCLQGTALAEMAGNPVAMARPFGEGRLAVIDAGFAADAVPPEPGRKKPPPEYGIHLEQNEKFVIQIVAWLLGAL